MKIIATDNYDREMYDDRLVCENVNAYYAELIVDFLNERGGENSDNFYKAVEADYVLHTYEL